MSGVYVALGGALGTLLRFGLTGWVQGLTGGTFPWGTMTVNVVGSILLGFAVVWLGAAATSIELRQFVTIGMLGAFTTFSTFTYEAAALMQDRDWSAAAGYVFGNLVVGLFGVVLGIGLASYLLLPKA